MFSMKIFSNIKILGAIILTVLLQAFIVYEPFLKTIFKTTSLGLVPIECNGYVDFDNYPSIRII
ncbi:MAG: cation transporting ATPase C-terminal domain-containing protein [Ferruginibacter sp.]